MPSGLIYRVSDISADDFTVMQRAWPELPLERRQRFAARIASVAQDDYQMDFSRFASILATDSDESVRVAGFEALAEYETDDYQGLMLRALRSDESALVRAAAATGLAGPVLRAELIDLTKEEAHAVEDALSEAFLNPEEDVEVRRRALESLAFSGRDEIAGFIRDAYHDDNPRMRVSAVFAMGRSGDEQWRSTVIDLLEDEDNELRFEAVRAAGELELQEAVPLLFSLAQERDREIALMAVDSLGLIGGEEVERFLLMLLRRTRDQAVAEVIEDALSNAALVALDFTRFVAAENDEEPHPDTDDPDDA